MLFLDDMMKDNYKHRDNKYQDVKGSPYYFDEWENADLTLNDGKQFSNVKVKLNMLSQEIICQNSNGTEITLRDGITKRLILHDTTAADKRPTHLFTSNIPFIEKDTSYPVFEVLTEGKASLLSLTKKRISNASDAMLANNAKEFTSVETVYIYLNSNLKKCEKKSDFFIALFSDKKDNIINFIKANNLKCRNRDEMMRVVSYYNTL